MEIINNLIQDIKRNPLLYVILIVIVIYLIVKKPIEKFTSIGSTSADNLAKLATYISSNGNDFTIPGNLRVKGNLAVQHINTRGVWVYNLDDKDKHNIPIGTSSSNEISTYINRDGLIKSSGQGFTAITHVDNINAPTNIHEADFAVFNYTPTYRWSIIRFQYDGSYEIKGGTQNDEYYLKIYFNDPNTKEEKEKMPTRFLQYNNAGGGGGRSGALFPISGTYRNWNSKSQIKIHLYLKRTRGDDNIDFSNLSLMIMETQL